VVKNIRHIVTIHYWNNIYPTMPVAGHIDNHLGKRLETVIWFTERSVDEDLSAGTILTREKAGCCGWGRAIGSLANAKSTNDIVGLSAGSFCTHNSPICMHLKIPSAGLLSTNKGSTNSIAFPSIHNLHACEFGFIICHNITCQD